MRKILLMLPVLVLGTWSLQAQMEYKIQFSYDSAGNQILRDRVCANCPAAKAVLDSTLVAETALEKDLLTDDLENSKDSRIVAYPNPVTDILNVEWIPSGNSVKQIVLFSMNNRQLYDRTIKPDQLSLGLDFSNYPSGLYIVLIVYADNSKQSFQVIKK